MLDLYSGLRGASRAMRERGTWDVFSVEVAADLVADAHVDMIQLARARFRAPQSTRRRAMRAWRSRNGARGARSERRGVWTWCGVRRRVRT